ncbi:MAG: methylthioribulose 1-phosphate dehydratase [Pseudomonadota bacterium]|nr:methylthioribulose 1-phosphate dehydratase [Pseudomonadota bacterium]
MSISPSLLSLPELISAAHDLGRRGLFPATGGNLSLRTGPGDCLVTVSGRDKGRLTEDDFMAIGLSGVPLDNTQKPSAETEVHLALYRADPEVGAVIHTHSVAATVLSRLVGEDVIVFTGYEMQKSIRGMRSHEQSLNLPVFDNTQDMPHLARQLERRWAELQGRCGFLVRGHGLYAWGRDVAEARRHVEGWEFLLACDLQHRQLAR